MNDTLITEIYTPCLHYHEPKVWHLQRISLTPVTIDFAFVKRAPFDDNLTRSWFRKFNRLESEGTWAVKSSVPRFVTRGSSQRNDRLRIREKSRDEKLKINNYLK